MTRRDADALSVAFVELIRREMDRQQLTIAGLAKRMEVPRQTVSEVLNQPGAITSATMTKWFDALRLEPVLKTKRKRNSNGN